MPECRYCKLDKPQSEFRRNKSYTSGWDTLCRTCNNEYSKQHRHTNPFRYKAWKYKTSEEEIRRILASSNSCAICGTTSLRLVIDHDHETGKIRELLCDLCNKGIGALKDDPKIIEQALLYLKKHGK